MESNRILENVDGPWWSQSGPTERSWAWVISVGADREVSGPGYIS